jgi:hypothetical protein
LTGSREVLAVLGKNQSPYCLTGSFTALRGVRSGPFIVIRQRRAIGALQFLGLKKPIEGFLFLIMSFDSNVLWRWWKFREEPYRLRSDLGIIPAITHF